MVAMEEKPILKSISKIINIIYIKYLKLKEWHKIRRGCKTIQLARMVITYLR